MRLARSICAGLFVLSALSLRAATDGSYISVSPFCARADGIQTCTVTVNIFNDSQVPLSGQSVTLLSSRGPADVIGPANPQLTGSSGQAVFTVRSSVRGSSTLSALCNGQLITKGIIQNGAVGIWSFEGAARDLSGKNNHGTLQGAPSFVAGKHGQALSLDGLSQYVSVAHNSSLNNRHAWTIDAWIYMNAIPTGRAVILQKSLSSSGDFYMSLSNNAVRTRCATRAGEDTLNDYAIQTPNGVLATGKWQHLVGVWAGMDSDPVWDDGSLRIFVDGVQKKSYDISRYLCRNQSEPLNLGRDPGGDSFFDGILDEVKLYNRPLYPPEIQRSMKFSTSVDFFLEPPLSPAASIAQPECVRLSWARSTNSNLTSYRVYRSTSPGVAINAANRIDEVPCEVTTCSDWYVDYGTRYYYVVTACSMSNESVASAEVSAVPAKAPSSPRWYGGDTHVHSINSQDVMYHPPTELADKAKARGFDWLFLTDHNSIVGRHELHTNCTPAFIGLAGEEVSLSTSGDNDHFNAFFIKQYVDVDGSEVDLHNRVRAQGGFAMPNHCGYYTETTNIDGLEVVRGGNLDRNAANAWDYYLKKGYKIMGRGATDTHGDPGRVVTLAWLDRLSAKELYNAFKYGRTCAVTGPGIQCMLKINGAMIGDTLKVRAGTTLNVTITANSDATITDMSLVRFGSEVWSAAPNATTVSRSFTDVSGKTNNYYRLEVHDSAGKWALGGAVYVEYDPNLSNPPQITTNLPAQVTVPAGKSYTYRVGVSGSDPLKYQWSKDSVWIPGATNSSYTWTAASLGSSAYRVVITNLFGAVTSVVSTATTIALIGDAYASNVLALQPVGYWPLQETTPPARVTLETNYGTMGKAGNAYYATPVASPLVSFGQAGALAAAGSLDPSVAFSGPSGTNYAFVPRGGAPALTLHPPLTLECWVNSSSTQFADLISQGGSGLNSPPNSGNFGGIRMCYGGNFSGGPNLAAFVYTGSGGVFNVGGTNIETAANSVPIGSWHHCVTTYDGTNVLLYVDGQVLGSGTTSMAVDSWSPLTIGDGRWQNGSPTRPYTGSLDEVAVYTNVLAPLTVLNHYRLGTNSASLYTSAVLAARPLLYYRMNCPGYVTPNPLACPEAVNYGSAPVNGLYFAGLAPGGVSGPPVLGPPTNRAALINGIFACVDAGMDNAFNPVGTQPFTALVWFKTGLADGRIQTLMGHGLNNWSLNLDGTTGRLVLDLGGAGQVGSTRILNDGLWHMAAGVFDGVRGYLFVDGALNALSPLSGGLTGESEAELYLGGNADCTAVGVDQRFFAGAIAHAAFFAKALTSVQIASLYTAATVPRVTMDFIGGTLALNYTGTLLSSTNLAGPYQPVPGATSPYSVPRLAPQQFYRVSNP